MKIKIIPVGMLQANCYLVYDEEAKEAMVIDPGAPEEKILEEINALDLVVKYLVNTHGHYDHVEGNAYVHKATGALLYIHEEDSAMMTEVAAVKADGFLRDGQILEVGKLRWTVLHTPGHTKGGICLVGQGVCFSGDTLFAGTIGRTDFPDGSLEEMMRSLETKLAALPDETTVYPGHGPQTTIGQEKRLNPYLSRFTGWAE
ncbi:MAG TPA: MBL fold metallo-hydrolase [Clostridia bacterium]|nr:MBL fold metallo-hydrolase [Clostridia bacterium]